jgi:hypothetical protein
MVDEPIAVAVGPVPEGTTLVTTDDDREVPRQFMATYREPGGFLVYVVVSVLDDDVPVIRELRLKISDEDLGYWTPTVEDLRLPLSKILDAAVRAAEEGVKLKGDAAGTALIDRPRRTRQKLTSARLNEIADVLHDAEERGVSTRRAVAEHFGLGSELTARNWIKAAREHEKKDKR